MAHPDDAELAKILSDWVRDGTASVVSGLSTSVPKVARATTRSGRDMEWVTENDQDPGYETGVALLTPSAFEKVFIGASLDADARWPEDRNDPYVPVGWKATFSPCDERTVPWPYWWPENHKKKPPTVSWYQQKDFFVEEVLAQVTFAEGDSPILGIMPRPDDLDPECKRSATLDVILAQIEPGEKPVVPAKAAVPHWPNRRCTILGFGMNDRDAVELLADGTTAHGRPLLDMLLKKLATGSANLRVFSSVASSPGQRSTLDSSRRHTYPTEMPTFPSAWETRPVGARIEVDGGSSHHMEIAFDFHPALPRRAEWRCALETPDLFMWLPQFFVRNVRTVFDFGDDGVALLGAMRTPECQQGVKGIIPGETLVLIAKLDGMVTLPEDNAPRDPRVELEAVVFDIPAAEAANWKSGIEGLTDDARFAALMERTQGKDVKLAAHVAVATAPKQEATVDSIEEVRTVIEVDPPRDNSPSRYRPTAMDMIPSGTTWQVTADLITPEDPLRALGPLEIHISHTLRHDVSPPREPKYEDMIAAGEGPLPVATVMEEAWEGETTLVPGKARFIGTREPPGDAFKGRLHVAFLRARVTEGREAKPDPAGAAPVDPFSPVR
jgi:hypothetical protein